MRRIRHWCACTSLLALVLFISITPISARQRPSLEGTVRDATGGVIVGALVELTNAGGEMWQAVTNERGEYQFDGLPPGEYTLLVTLDGFAPVRQPVRLGDGTSRVPITLTVVYDEKVQVSETLSLHDSALSRTLTRRELALLPNDSRLLLQRLREMAGSRGRRGDVAIYVDGFREGLRLPPRDTIDMVRISAHPFSAEFSEPGHARVEITTRPGAEVMKADFSASFSSDELNARDPFATTKPDSELQHLTGYLSGPVVRGRLGFTAFAGRWTEAQTRVFNATVLDENLDPVPATGVVTAPTRIDSVLAGLNTMAGRRHSVRLLYGYEGRTEDNQGLDTAFDLPDRAYGRSTREVSGRGSLFSILTPSVIGETHVEVSRGEESQAAVTSGPATIVLDAFHAGANQDAFGRAARTDSVEARSSLTAMLGSLLLKTGVQAEYTRSRLNDRSGFDGRFLFGSDIERDADGRPMLDENGQTIPIAPIERYRRTLLGLPGYGPSQYSVVTGDPDYAYGQWWLAWFAQNDWKVRPDLTLSFGARQEWQTYLGRAGDLAARLGIGWRPGAAGNNTLRAGAGLFYDRIESGLMLDTTRHDGFHLREIIVDRPQGFPEPPPLDAGRLPTVHRKSDDMRAPRLFVATVSYERRLPGNLTAIAEYTHEQGDRLLLRRNVNAPGPDGTRPFPESGPILEYASVGQSRRREAGITLRFDLADRMTLNAGYMRTWSRATTDGFRTAPANPDALDLEWGMPLADREHQGHVSATFYLPGNVYFSPYVTASSGRPFNITTGRDINRDTFYTERPGLASPGEPGAIETPFGWFMPDPLPGAPIVERNAGRGRPEVRMDLHLSKLQRLPGNIKVTFAADVQNVLNRPVYTGYTTLVTSPLFGQPNRALPGRRMLLTARVSY